MTGQTLVNNRPADPIILSPGSGVTSETSKKRSFLSTLSLLFAGWFLGNLIVLAVISLAAISIVGASGLVKVPVLSQMLFGKSVAISENFDQEAYDSASKKIEEIKSLRTGQSLDQIELDETEVNSLLAKQTSTDNEFPIINTHLRLLDQKFELTGNYKTTNAPVSIIGKINVSSLTARVELEYAKFGKFNLPTFIAGSIVDNALSQIGLSLQGSELPAKSVTLENGTLTLHEVVNPNKSD